MHIDVFIFRMSSNCHWMWPSSARFLHWEEGCCRSSLHTSSQSLSVTVWMTSDGWIVHRIKRMSGSRVKNKKNGLLCRSILVPVSMWTRVLKLGHRDRSLTPALIRPAALQCKHRALLCGASLHIQYVKIFHNKAVATLAPSLSLKQWDWWDLNDRRLWWWSFSCCCVFNTILRAHLEI